MKSHFGTIPILRGATFANWEKQLLFVFALNDFDICFTKPCPRLFQMKMQEKNIFLSFLQKKILFEKFLTGRGTDMAQESQLCFCLNYAEKSVYKILKVIELNTIKRKNQIAEYYVKIIEPYTL